MRSWCTSRSTSGGRRSGGDLEPHDVSEAPAQQLCLDGLEQIVGVAGDGEIGVARDAEHGVADLVARDHCRQEVQDRVLDRNAGAVAADLDEPRQVVGHVDADEPRRGLDAVGRDDADVQGQRRQKWERGGRADRDRCQERLDLAPEALRQRSQLAARALVHRDDADAFRGERRTQLVEPERFLRLLQGARPRAHIRQCPSRRPSVGKAPPDRGLDLRQQAGDTHRVELVEVRGDDPAELHALEQRHVVVRRDLEHALVEVEPRELAVEEARGPLGRIARDGARARRLGCHRNDYGRSSSSRLTPCSVLAMFLPSLKPAGAARKGAAHRARIAHDRRRRWGGHRPQGMNLP